MSNYPILSSFNNDLSLDKVALNQALVIEIQSLLIEGGFLNDKADGKLGAKTLAAFKHFKSRAFLQHENVLGRATAKALLEISGQDWHPNPTDNNPKKLSSNKFRLPSGDLASTNEKIYGCDHFSWGEATHNGQRIPKDKNITTNIIRMAQYLEKIRTYFDGKIITINSWYRPADINRAVGGASNSTHIQGYAVDFVVQDIPPLEVYRKLDRWHENVGGLGKSTMFTHLDLRGYKARWIYGR